MAEERKVNGSLALQGRERRVITIAASQETEAKKLRVAAYARVSSDSEDQLNSYAAQNRYFATLISANEKWEMADIYADEGITGTSADKRSDFQRLLADCRRGQIDRVITKSVSRFARNTKECLTVVRELKALGVSVYFEEQSIDTGVATGELLTAVFASLAQAESESISKNMRWSYQQRMQSGEFITCKAPYGFRLKGRTLEIYEPEAQIVREIYSRFLAGESCEEIAGWINELGIPTRDGHPQWRASAIRYILRNERNIGDALLQKRYTTDTLPFKKGFNKGHKDQYFLENSHDAIIAPESYYAAQTLMRLRAEKISTGYRKDTLLMGKLKCGNCGATFKSKTNKGIHYWVCRNHNLDKAVCPITQIPEEEISSAFLRLYHKLKLYGESMLEEVLSALTQIRNRRMLWSVDIIELNNRIGEILEQDRQLNELNSLGLADPDFYIQRSNELAEQPVPPSWKKSGCWTPREMTLSRKRGI